MSIFNNILDRFNGNRDRKILNDIMESVSALPIMRESYPTSSAAQLAIDDAGWISFNGSGAAYGETDQPTRRRIIERARAYWRQDPLAHQAVRIWTDYAIGDGITLGCEDAQAEKTLLEFWESSGNRLQFSAEGQRVASTRLLVDGDIFYALVGEPPEVLVRSIDPLEITSIIADPDDSDRILFYRREWIPTDISGRPQSVKTLYYRDWTLDPSEAEDLAKELNATLEDGVSIYHVAFDRYGRWGNSLLTSSLNWNREHRKFMESRVSIIQSLARFAFKAKVSGGQSALTAIKNSLAPTAGSQQPMGATWLENSGIELNAMPRDTGASSAKGDGDMLKLQICAATGIMEHYFGNGANSNLATACYSEDTEYLGENGWRKYFEYSGEKIAAYDPQTNEIKYEVPKAQHLYPFHGELIHFKGRGVDCLVTPNHRMWARLTPHNAASEKNRGWKSTTPFQFITAEELISQKQRFSFVNRGLVTKGLEPDVLNIGPYEWDICGAMGFMGLFLSEGSTYLANSGNYFIEFAQKSSNPHSQRIETLLERLFGKSCKKDERNGISRWVISNKDLYYWVRNHCGVGSGLLRIPKLIWDLSKDAKTKLFHWMMDGDGHHHGDTSGFYSTSSVSLLNDFQRLCCEIGVSCHTRKSRQKEGCLPEYIAQIRLESDSLEIEPSRNCSRVKCGGTVWCFETSTGIFITRRNGKIAFQGNTAMELPMLKMFTSYQRLWSDVYSDIFCYVAGVNRPGDIGLDIDWPPIVDIDDNLRANAISTLVTSFPSLTKLDAVKAQVLETLRINNSENVLEEMKAAEEEEKSAEGQEKEEPLATMIRPLEKGASKIKPADDGEENPEESGGTFIDALRRFRESI